MHEYLYEVWIHVLTGFQLLSIEATAIIAYLCVASTHLTNLSSFCGFVHSVNSGIFPLLGSVWYSLGTDSDIIHFSVTQANTEGYWVSFQCHSDPCLHVAIQKYYSNEPHAVRFRDIKFVKKTFTPYWDRATKVRQNQSLERWSWTGASLL